MVPTCGCAEASRPVEMHESERMLAASPARGTAYGQPLPGRAHLEIVANGIASDPVEVHVK